VTAVTTANFSVGEACAQKNIFCRITSRKRVAAVETRRACGRSSTNCTPARRSNRAETFRAGQVSSISISLETRGKYGVFAHGARRSWNRARGRGVVVGVQVFASAAW